MEVMDSGMFIFALYSQKKIKTKKQTWKSIPGYY